MKILKGAEVSAKIKEQVTQMMEGLEGPAPKLAIVRVGEKPDDMSYERGAVKKMENFGLRVQTYVFPEQISDSDFKAEFSAINRDPDVSGILLLRPLPKQIAETDIEKMIDPEKDLDGISPANIAKVFAGDKTGFAPCTAEAVIEVLKANEIDMTGKNVTIVGRSMVVGRPLSMLMLKENATVTICHTKTEYLKKECSRADILISAAGQAGLITGDMVKEGAVVVDVAVNRRADGPLCGDVVFEEAAGRASYITPVPGGVGPLTRAMLMKNTLYAAVIHGK